MPSPSLQVHHLHLSEPDVRPVQSPLCTQSMGYGLSVALGGLTATETWMPSSPLAVEAPAFR
jgi:hypothetical protein